MQIVPATVFRTRRAPSLIDMSACDERGQAFYVCAQPMPHDMGRILCCHAFGRALATLTETSLAQRISQQLAEVCMQRWMNDEYEPVLEQMGSLVGAKRSLKRGRQKDWNSTKLGWQELLDSAGGEERACPTTLPSQDRGEDVHRKLKTCWRMRRH